MPNIGGPEIIVILAIVLIVFGAGKLPEVLGQLGKGVREFKNAASGEEKDKTSKTTSTTSEQKN